MAMIRSINFVVLVGRVGTIFDRRDLPNHKPGPVNISINTQEIYADKKQRSDWHKVTFWGAPADFAEKYLVVGTLVSVVGALRTTQKRNADGSLSSYVNIEGHQIIVLARSPRDKEEGEDKGGEPPDDDTEPEDTSGREKDPDEIPF